jgi:mannose-6-phosphate isomerase-like protein (cupin superfamily)
MIENIIHNNTTYAVILRANYQADGIKFLTPNNFSQQLGYMNRPAGYQIEPHFHNEVKREVFYTNEVLFIRSGRVRVDFYDDRQVFIQSNILNALDTILLVSGGHGFEILEDAQIIEVKQGPYVGESDKTRFPSIF